VGRIDRKNNVAFLIEAFAKYIDCHNPNFPGALVVVGGDDSKSMDHEVYSSLNGFAHHDKVIFTGRVPDADLPAIYSGAQVAVITSHHEGFCLVAAEAMACGTPLIAHATGAIPEVVGQAARLQDNLDVNELASTIHEVISNPALQKQLRESGLKQAQAYQNNHDARETFNLYQKIAGTNRD
jgi:glycosyltransferase involved in cell wall biosynthesis